MTPVTASAWVEDRLSRGWREGSALGGRSAEDALRRRSARCPDRSGGGGRLTLEQRLDSVWEGLRADGAAECPVCGGRMEGLDFARCTSCGSELF
jgi:hypothetical protein